jgi:hypothetical protein
MMWIMRLHGMAPRPILNHPWVLQKLSTSDMGEV